MKNSRHRFWRHALAAAVASLIAIQGTDNAIAASETGGFAVRGIGAQTCGALGEALAGDHAEEVLQLAGAWTAGYVSHHNRATPATYDALPILDNTAFARVALNLCSANPDQLFEAIVASLIESMARGALAQESGIIEIGHDGNGVRLRREVLRKVQLVLIDEGMLGPDTADGQYGPLSRAALLEFQKDQGLTQSGIPDPSTLIVIFARGRPRTGDSRTQ